MAQWDPLNLKKSEDSIDQNWTAETMLKPKTNICALRVVCCREIRRICPAKTCWAFFLVIFLPSPNKSRTGGDFTDTNEIDHAKRRCPVAVAYNVDLRTLQYRIEPQRLQHETNRPTTWKAVICRGTTTRVQAFQWTVDSRQVQGQPLKWYLNCFITMLFH